MLCICEGTRFEVPVESGLEEEKALEILALYVNGKPQALPEQARSIVSECKGTTDPFYSKHIIRSCSLLHDWFFNKFKCKFNDIVNHAHMSHLLLHNP